ncbi:unnamed protein product [Rotaria sp. Silwood1]|nr:unnamed protein product [Rotaria sp. Silwood1]
MSRLFEFDLLEKRFKTSGKPAIRNYIRSPRGQWAYWTSYGVFFATYIALACCKRLGRRYPLNLILLSILTLSMSYMV